MSSGASRRRRGRRAKPGREPACTKPLSPPLSPRSSARPGGGWGALRPGVSWKASCATWRLSGKWWRRAGACPSVRRCRRRRGWSATSCSAVTGKVGGALECTARPMSATARRCGSAGCAPASSCRTSARQETVITVKSMLRCANVCQSPNPNNRVRTNHRGRRRRSCRPWTPTNGRSFWTSSSPMQAPSTTPQLRTNPPSSECCSPPSARSVPSAAVAGGRPASGRRCAPFACGTRPSSSPASEGRRPCGWQPLRSGRSLSLSRVC